jgi:hypothetical protein
LVVDRSGQTKVGARRHEFFLGHHVDLPILRAVHRDDVCLAEIRAGMSSAAMRVTARATVRDDIPRRRPVFTWTRRIRLPSSASRS